MRLILEVLRYDINENNNNSNDNNNYNNNDEK